MASSISGSDMVRPADEPDISRGSVGTLSELPLGKRSVMGNSPESGLPL